MKKIFLFIGLLLSFQVAWTQAASDSTLVQLIGKEASDVIFSPEKTKSYSLNPLKSSRNQKHLLDKRFTILKEAKEGLSKEQLSQIHALLQESNAFINDGKQSRVPFAPEAAFEFWKGQSKTTLYIFLSGSEIGISHQGDNIKRLRMNDLKSIKKLLGSIFPKNDFFREKK